jgi:hypothetical protein
VREQDWRAAGARIEALISGDRDEELVRLVADLYGAGLERLLELLHEHGALPDEVIDAVARDELVSGLLLVHGLHPYDAATRVRHVLTSPGLAGTGTELVEITAEGVCRLRVRHGLPAGVEQAIEAAAPEVTRVEVDRPEKPLIPVDALFARLSTATP